MTFALVVGVSLLLFGFVMAAIWYQLALMCKARKRDAARTEKRKL